MATDDQRRGPLLTVLVVLFVGAAMLTQNLIAGGPYVVRQRYAGDLWETRKTIYGWPFAYYRSTQSLMIASRFGAFDGPAPAPINQTASPRPSWRNPQTLALLANIALGLSMLAATAVVSEYWRRGRSARLQFSLRSLFVITALIAMTVSLLKHGLMHWSTLLWPGIAVGILALPAAAGLVLDHYVRRSDREITRLRRQLASRGESQ